MDGSSSNEPWLFQIFCLNSLTQTILLWISPLVLPPRMFSGTISIGDEVNTHNIGISVFIRSLNIS